MDLENKNLMTVGTNTERDTLTNNNKEIGILIT